MHYRLFSLQPDIFESFFSTSLIARALEKGIIQKEIINWREDFGIGNYRQVDDSPFGGGSGMVLQPEPIFQALQRYKAISSLFQKPTEPSTHSRIFPNNQAFEALISQKPTQINSVTISLTPRGFPLNQQVLEWLATNFSQINLLCGRYEGFDARVSEFVDLELSIGNFVTNGGEAPAMSLIEGISRLLPDFVTKNTSVLHDSFSSQLNNYQEQAEFVIGKRKMTSLTEKADHPQNNLGKPINPNKNPILFDNSWWQKNILPFIEHPQYTRPETWQNWQVPALLLEGNHKKIQHWRQNWW